jgi:hypothetical protein
MAFRPLGSAEALDQFRDGAFKVRPKAAIMLGLILGVPILAGQQLVNAPFADIEIKTSTKKTWRVDENLQFDYDAPRLPRKLTLRQFRGTIDQVKASATLTSDGKCYVLSSSIWIPERINGVIDFDSKIDGKWLHPVDGGGFNDENWLVIFEAGRNDNGTIRIGKDYFDGYLKKGFPMFVEAPLYLKKPDRAHMKDVKSQSAQARRELHDYKLELVLQEPYRNCQKVSEPNNRIAMLVPAENCDCMTRSMPAP